MILEGTLIWWKATYQKEFIIFYLRQPGSVEHKEVNLEQINFVEGFSNRVEIVSKQVTTKDNLIRRGYLIKLKL
jgi:hypothetical protein